MGLINCPECGKEVSDKAKTCIHCGAPLHFSDVNGVVKIKCSSLGGRMLSVKITNTETNEVIAEIKPNETKTINLTKDTSVHLSYLALKGTDAVLEYAGMHYYNITTRPGILTEKLVIQEVTNIDSD